MAKAAPGAARRPRRGRGGRQEGHVGQRPVGQEEEAQESHCLIRLRV